MLELPALTFIYHTHGEENRAEPSVAEKQRSRGEEKWDYLPIQKRAKMGVKST